jgi:hypothetical protein
LIAVNLSLAAWEFTVDPLLGCMLKTVTRGFRSREAGFKGE